MTVCNFRMMRSLFMVVRFVLLGGLAVMFGSMLMVLRRLFMMFVISCSATFVSRKFLARQN
jgi:hypothetical protein